MKVTVTKYLNVRVGKPSVNAPNYQYLAPGSVLEIDGNLYEGDAYDGVSTWYKDLAGNYYWSGGVVPPLKDLEQDILLDRKVDFRKLIKLKNFSFRQIDPQNPSKIKIAILDSGIYSAHPDFVDESTFINNSNNDHISQDQNYVDQFGHGTKVSGIIGSRNADIIGISGVCPDCSMLSIKTLNERGKAYSDSVRKGLIELRKHSQIKIANLSFALADNAYDKISQLFDELATNKILVAAAGNEEILNGEPNSPAKNSNIISVASLPMEDLLNPALIPPKGVDYILPKLEVISTSKDPKKLYDVCMGSSFSAPIVTGLIAELSMTNPNLNNKKQAMDILNEHCYSLEEFRDKFKNLKTYENGIPVIKTH